MTLVTFTIFRVFFLIEKGLRCFSFDQTTSFRFLLIFQVVVATHWSFIAVVKFAEVEKLDFCQLPFANCLLLVHSFSPSVAKASCLLLRF